MHHAHLKSHHLVHLDRRNGRDFAEHRVRLVRVRVLHEERHHDVVVHTNAAHEALAVVNRGELVAALGEVRARPLGADVVMPH